MSDKQIIAMLPHMFRTGDPRLNQYLAGIYDRGFSLRAIADVVGCSYETVRTRLLRAAQEQSAGYFADLEDLPIPTILPKHKRAHHTAYAMSDSVRELIARANKEAQQYRHGRDPQMVHAFNALVTDLIGAGVPFTAIAEACGQDRRHLRRRMDRWGVHPTSRRKPTISRRPILQEVVVPEATIVVDDGPWKAVGVPCKWPDCESHQGGVCIHG